YHRLGFARPAHDLGGPAAISGGKDDLGAPHMLLQGAAIRDDRLKPTAIHWGDVGDSSCSPDQSLNCFTRFWNRPNSFDHLVGDNPRRLRSRVVSLASSSLRLAVSTLRSALVFRRSALISASWAFCRKISTFNSLIARESVDLGCRSSWCASRG